MIKNSTIFKRFIAVNLAVMFLFSLVYFVPLFSDNQVFAASLRETHFSDDPYLVYSSNFGNVEETSGMWRIQAQYDPTTPEFGSLAGESVFGLGVTMSKAMLGSDNHRLRVQDFMMETYIWGQAVDQPGRQIGVLFRAHGVPPVEGQFQNLFNFSGLGVRVVYDGVVAGYEGEARLQLVNFMPFNDPTVIAEADVMFAQERLVPLRVVAVGPNITVYINDMDTPALVAETSLHNAAGEVGIWALWSAIRVANFNIWSTTPPAEFVGVTITAETDVGVEIPAGEDISAGDFLIATADFVGFDTAPSASYRWFRVSDPTVTWDGFGAPPRGWQEIPGAMRFEYEIALADARHYLAVVATSNDEIRVSATVGPIAFDGDLGDHLRFIRGARFLSILGIIDVLETELNAINPMETVTRGDFSTILANALNLSSIVGTGTHVGVFYDVPYTNRNASIIELFHRMGIVSGFNGVFLPNDSIRLIHAVRMVVTGLGYDDLAQGLGGYPMGYIITARSLRLMDGIGGDLNEPARFNDIVTLIYNALDVDVPVFEGIVHGRAVYGVMTGRTLLAERHNVIQREGTVTASGAMSMFADLALTADEVEISGEIFYVGTTNASDFFGYSVMFYATNPEDPTARRTLLFIEPANRNVKTVIPDRDIIAYTGGQLSIDDGTGRTRRINFAQNVVVLYNGLRISPVAADFDISGNVTIFDWNGNGVADLVIIYSLQTFVVRNSSNTRISFMLGNTVTIDGVTQSFIDLDTEDETSNHVIWRDGRRIQVSDLQEWDVISIAASRNGSRIEVYVSNDNVTGTVTVIDSEDRVYIDGRGPFEIGGNYLAALASGNAEARSIGLGSMGTFHLAVDGRIAGFNPQRGAETRFGYLLAVQYTSGFDAKLEFGLIATDAGGYTVKTGAERIEFNGHGRITRERVSVLLTDWLRSRQFTPGRPGVVIQYRTNTAGEIVQITTEHWYPGQVVINPFDTNESITLMGNVDTNGNPRPAEASLVQETNPLTTTLRYDAANVFAATTPAPYHFFINNMTTVFVIEVTGNVEDHWVGSMSYFRVGRSFHIRGYNLDEWRHAEVAVLYRNPNIQTLGVGIDVDASHYSSEQNMFIVNEVGMTLGQDGETVREISGLFAGNANARFSLVNLTPLYSMLEGIQRGDALHFETNSAGEIIRMRILFQQSNPIGTRFLPTTSPPNANVTNIFFGRERGVGRVVNISPSQQRISVMVNNGTYDILRVFRFPAQSVMVFDGRSEVRIGTMADVSIGDTILYLSNYGELRELVVYKNLAGDYD